MLLVVVGIGIVFESGSGSGLVVAAAALLVEWTPFFPVVPGDCQNV